MSKKKLASETVTQYDARAAWDYGVLDDHFESQIPQAIFRGETIVIDWPPSIAGETTHTVLTRTAGSKYRGQSIWASRTPKEKEAVVEAVLYSNELGHVLVGEERWLSGYVDFFVVQFSNGRTV
jgi:hypothetical protein